ncbi:MAG: SUMF1/EgtB/PvdO family nonheme iron enzyme [Anaerolineaceae bacterium]|nr:SUMF1/EgtB/PvdO family nonheme iron enzyme [Anaerolineaceae bacterium]
MNSANLLLPSAPEEEPESASRLHLPEMILVPSGECWIGTSEEQMKQLVLVEDWARDWLDNDLFQVEQPDHQLSLPAFEIARYPVTNEEYYQFVLETSYRIPRGWTGLRFLEGQGLHPVTWVSWRDTQAYLDWVNESTNNTFRLPTEVEWERSARGDDRRVYPWGTAFDSWRCNTVESGKRWTAEVGSYSPGGDSPFGVEDMVGNVWEWTSSLLRPYPYNGEDGREDHEPGSGKRVVRGGAWYYSKKLARCSVREGLNIDYLSGSLGFRLARKVNLERSQTSEC